MKKNYTTSLLSLLLVFLTLADMAQAHYSPELGRFLSRDPIEERGGVNVYAFVKNEPIAYWDRLGREFTSEIKHRAHDSIQHVFGTHANTRFRAPKLVGQHVIEESDSKCCATVKKAKDIKQHIITFMFTFKTGIADFVISNKDGYDAVFYHEQRRVMAYRLAYDAYFARNQGYGANVLRCGTVCRKNKGEAKQLLLEYLNNVQAKALNYRSGGNGYFEDVKRMQDVINTDSYTYGAHGARSGIGLFPDFGLPNQFFDFEIWQIGCPQSE